MPHVALPDPLSVKRDLVSVKRDLVNDYYVLLTQDLKYNDVALPDPESHPYPWVGRADKDLLTWQVLLMCCECVANVLLMCDYAYLAGVANVLLRCCECVANVLLMCCSCVANVLLMCDYAYLAGACAQLSAPPA